MTFALLAEVGRALTRSTRLPAPRGAERAGDEFAAITLASAERDGDRAPRRRSSSSPRRSAAGLRLRVPRDARLRPRAARARRLPPLRQRAGQPRRRSRAASYRRTRAPRCAEELVAVATAWELALAERARRAAATTRPRPCRRRPLACDAGSVDARPAAQALDVRCAASCPRAAARASRASAWSRAAASAASRAARDQLGEPLERVAPVALPGCGAGAPSARSSRRASGAARRASRAARGSSRRGSIEAPALKRSCTALATLLTFWPPGPGARM